MDNENVTPFPVAPMYYIPMQYAVSLYNQGRSKEDAAKITVERFAFYGKHNNKRLKQFDRHQFTNQFYKFISTPDALLVRRSSKHQR